jgi:hypothetical protein
MLRKEENRSSKNSWNTALYGDVIRHDTGSSRQCFRMHSKWCGLWLDCAGLCSGVTTSVIFFGPIWVDLCFSRNSCLEEYDLEIWPKGRTSTASQCLGRNMCVRRPAVSGIQIQVCWYIQATIHRYCRSKGSRCVPALGNVFASSKTSTKRYVQPLRDSSEHRSSVAPD